MRQIDVNIIRVTPSQSNEPLEIQLLKPALLYGDHVRLFSDESFQEAVRKATTWESMPLAFRQDLAEQFRSHAEGSPSPLAHWIAASEENYHHFIRTGRIIADSDQFTQYGLFLRDLISTFKDPQKSPPGADAIIKLKDLGLISIYSSVYEGDLAEVPELELPLLESDTPEDVLHVASIFSKRIWKIWNTPEAFPFFDETLGYWAQQLANQNSIAQGKGSGRQRELSLAGQFFGSLPDFPRATIDELIDIKRDLEDPLRRFRLALAGISEELSATLSSDEFRGEAHSLWVKEVLPAVQEIQDSVRSNRYLYQLTEHFLTKPDGLIAAGGLIIGAMAAHDVPRLVASASTAVLPAARALWESRKGVANLQRNKFYFIYALGQRVN